MATTEAPEAQASTSGPVQFLELSADSQSDGQPMKLESLCMNCWKNGETTMLMAKIPHFREVVLCSFECPHCGLRNNEVQFAGVYGEQGIKLELTVPRADMKALSRQVVKSDAATVRIPELDLEIPAATQKGTITTVEGLLSNAADNLRLLQEERRAADPATAEALDAFLGKLDACISGEQAFTLVLDDPAGNSYVESGAANPADDEQLKIVHYQRTREQQVAVGLQPEGQEGEAAEAGESPEISASDPHHGARPVGAAAAKAGVARTHGAAAAAIMSKYSSPEEVIELPGRCFACDAETPTRMYQTNIPYFKDVIIMSNSCDKCGYRNSEVKAGGATSDKGREITLKVEQQEDLRRDVIKSETASVSVPELELELTTGTMGGLVTTVEGLLDSVAEALKRTQSFHLGDSAAQLDRSHWGAFFQGMDDCMALRRNWTLVIKDPLANSFIAPSTSDPELDPRLAAHDYERSAEEEAHFGIDHLKEEDLRELQKQGAQGQQQTQKAQGAGKQQQAPEKHPTDPSQEPASTAAEA
ncbi:hypothetical protein WJX72_000744 [[Myrmecia] bisecta]|uniref:Zinc finger ZPR1-type domain-containing protein n=1 Tax=[Myrmecia] bisecta TaxID=41462 RepID=A0AAW1Q9E1_9CHLO